MKRVKKVLLGIVIVIISIVVIISILYWVNSAEGERLSKVKQRTYDQHSYLKGLNRDDIAKSSLSGVTISPINNQHINGYHFKPQQIKHKGSIILFGGSEGSVSPNTAALLSLNGYEVFAMYFFGKGNLQKELMRVPLEQFEHIKAYVSENTQQPKPLTVIGTSKGAELGLLLASYYPNDIDNLVLYSPSAYVWQGLSMNYSNVQSSWTYKGKDLPFLKLSDASGSATAGFFADMIIGRPREFATMYESIIQRATNKSEATISTNNVRANLLMFAGGKDSVWPSATMAQTIKQHYPRSSRLEVYPNAGHVFFGPPVIRGMRAGGEYDANETAKTQSDAILLKQLDSWTKDNEQKA